MISRRTYDAEGGRGAGAQRQFGRRLAPRPGQTVGRAAQRLRRRPGHSRVAARAAEQRTRKKNKQKGVFLKKKTSLSRKKKTGRFQWEVAPKSAAGAVLSFFFWGGVFVP